MSRTRIIALTVALVIVVAVILAFVLKNPAGTGAPASELLRQISPTEVRDLVIKEAQPLTVVNFWASWCEPCKREFPHYLRLAKDYAGRGVRLIFISVDDRSDFTDADAFLRANGVNFLTFYKGNQSLNFVAEIYPPWTGAVPATVMFGPAAEILDAWEGDTTWTALEKRVLSKLAKP